MDATPIYTVVTRSRSYLVTAESAASIRGAQKNGVMSIAFDALRCCGECPEGTVRVEEDLSQIQGLIAHEKTHTVLPEGTTNVIPLFR
jgi:hypothetical protein